MNTEQLAPISKSPGHRPVADLVKTEFAILAAEQGGTVDLHMEHFAELCDLSVPMVVLCLWDLITTRQIMIVGYGVQGWLLRLAEEHDQREGGDGAI